MIGFQVRKLLIRYSLKKTFLQDHLQDLFFLRSISIIRKLFIQGQVLIRVQVRRPLRRHARVDGLPPHWYAEVDRAIRLLGHAS